MADSTEALRKDYTELAADIVAAYVSSNSLPLTDLPALISSVHAALSGLTAESAEAEAESASRPTPAQVRKSITPDALISFIDGKPYKTLKRHLSTHGLDIHAYRQRYGLPNDYPSTAANYSAQRSQLAKSLGLGQQRRPAAEVQQPEAPAEMPAPRARGRRKAAAA
ncbi:putative transcriptional regulator [Methylobacterium sp. BE186]|uniref:MucR family transcriptional regulator n=1 Tax=Methylobacterium sp. BE186 TaxID=2817715 RepID=UPI00285F5463|nr:MucR family transcriptional regulator [Methylobacterium sp. BE186]MDR7039655.1 putative transcriptional regulator [Methylobacterium sp. BE186]